MSARKVHSKLDIRGALLRSDEELRGIFEENGRTLTVREARMFLMGHLAKGHKVLPCSENCEGFDYFGGGCPGSSVGRVDGCPDAAEGDVGDGAREEDDPPGDDVRSDDAARHAGQKPRDQAR